VFGVTLCPHSNGPSRTTLAIMTLRIAVNGFGRIGRDYLRDTLKTDDVQVVAINDVAHSATLGRLLRHDSTFGPLGLDVEDRAGTLVVDGHKIAVSALREPAALP
jgi:glyceraldehyde 3-phosphate dehydrogenase